MNQRVLIVDDSLTVRMDLEEGFRIAGLHPIQAESLKRAHEVLARTPPDLIVLDQVLPDGDGIDFLEYVRATPHVSAIPVILLSSENDVGHRIRGLSAGASEFAGKPYHRDAVISMAMRLLRTDSTFPPPETRASVLIVDDSATYRQELGTALEIAGYRVIQAETGDRGLRLAERHRPNAIIVDGILPDSEGPDVVHRIRLDPALSETPCLLLTASLASEAELDSLDAGADAYMNKSDGLSVVLARLSALLRRDPKRDLRKAAESMFGPKRVLAIDDSRTYLDQLSTQLTQEGYDVVTAYSGEQALELLSFQVVDCILLDLEMPGLSGEETCKTIRRSPAWRDTPILVLTAKDEREAMLEALRAGADDFIAKASDFSIIRARLRAQLRRKQFESETQRIRDELHRKELEAREARAQRKLAETSAELLRNLEHQSRELAETNVALQEAKERAERESGFKSRFLANMSHELRTPLNAIIGFSELLRDGVGGPVTPVQQEYLEYILTGGRQLLSLINDVLDISKIEAGKLILQKERTDIRAIVSASEAIVAALVHRGELTFECVMPNDLPDLFVDPLRIKQVLVNLLSNAIKFTPPKGKVVVSVTREPEHVAISVSDTGIGINPHDLPRLFHEFEQIQPPSGEKPEGTGLGLTLTKRLVELHRGTIGVESTLQQGSTFTVRLPIEERS